MKSDRIRAKKPVNDVESWTKGEVVDVNSTDFGYSVTISTQSDEYELNLNDALYDLFTGRLESEDPSGETVWFKKK